MSSTTSRYWKHLHERMTCRFHKTLYPKTMFSLHRHLSKFIASISTDFATTSDDTSPFYQHYQHTEYTCTYFVSRGATKCSMTMRYNSFIIIVKKKKKKQDVLEKIGCTKILGALQFTRQKSDFMKDLILNDISALAPVKL